jgi:hypothetical protein
LQVPILRVAKVNRPQENLIMQAFHKLLGLAGLLCCLAAQANPHLDDAYSHDANDPFTDKSGWMKSIRDERGAVEIWHQGA